ncbi:MAG: hypothetical protein AB8U25_04775 [Rickettsiales endosymbiont of Dermacentor nuttalli]
MYANTAKIGPLVAKYFREDIGKKIVNRNNLGITYYIYSEYESDFTRNYTNLIGEEVSYFQNIILYYKQL